MTREQTMKPVTNTREKGCMMAEQRWELGYRTADDAQGHLHSTTRFDVSI